MFSLINMGADRKWMCLLALCAQALVCSASQEGVLRNVQYMHKQGMTNGIWMYRSNTVLHTDKRFSESQ